MKDILKVTFVSVCILGFLVFLIFGGVYNWVAFVFAALLVPFGVLDDMTADYKKLFRRR